MLIAGTGAFFLLLAGLIGVIALARPASRASIPPPVAAAVPPTRVASAAPAPSEVGPADPSPSVGGPTSPAPSGEGPAGPDEPGDPWVAPPPVDPGPDGRRLARALTTAMGDEAVSYRTRLTGSFWIGNVWNEVDIRVDIDGRDLAGTVELDGGRVRTRADVIVVDGASYVKPAGEAWLREDGATFSVPSLNPFFGDSTTLEGLRYMGTVSRGGTTLHHLRLPRIDWQALSTALLDENAGGMELRRVRADVYLHDNGLPHSLSMSMDGTAIADGLEVDTAIALDYAFSHFGHDFDIRAPRVTSGGGPTS